MVDFFFEQMDSVLIKLAYFFTGVPHPGPYGVFLGVHP